MNPPSLPPMPGDPNQSTRRSRYRSAVLLAAVVPVSPLMLVGCGRLRHNTAATPSTGATVTTAAPASSVPDATPTTASGGDSESQTLDSISQQLATVDSGLGAVDGDLNTANNAINSQEGDPSK